MLRRDMLTILIVLSLTALLAGCRSISPPDNVRATDHRLLITAYCKCGDCCGWRRGWFFRPVYSGGPRKGERKQIGITSSGARARMGTISADPAVFPVGTVMYVDGYGYGRVEDTGGGIKGNHIEVFFRSHQAALEWGKRQIRAKVWFPPGYRPQPAVRSGLDSRPAGDVPVEVVLYASHFSDEIGAIQ